MRFFQILTYVGAALGALLVAAGFVAAGSAVQEAAGAAISVALVVIPYCVASVMMRAETLRLLREAAAAAAPGARPSSRPPR